MAEEFSRLPASVVPTHYNISLVPDLKNFTFTGICEVSANVAKATNTIVCNAAELDISAATVTCGEKSEAGVVSLQEKEETATLTLPADLTTGAVTITQPVTRAMFGRVFSPPHRQSNR